MTAPKGWTQLELDWEDEDLSDEEYDDEADPGDLDGDHASALASAGWGTDEDYAPMPDFDW